MTASLTTSLREAATAGPPVSPGAATALLEAYRPDTDRFLAAPGHTLLCRAPPPKSRTTNAR